MAISPLCDKCGQELQDYGGILLSPPNDGVVKKFHLCKECYEQIENEVE